jgi:Transposase zinc-binding domain
VALPSIDYTPRNPAADVLYRVVRDHLQTFLAEAAHLRDGEGVPRFVEEEFHAFLACGWLAGGFARFRCSACSAERVIAFSCKGRGFCPSCGGRRMTERAAEVCPGCRRVGLGRSSVAAAAASGACQ